MLKINLKQMEAFAATVEYGSFTRAAEELYLTQSTVSAHISTLEQALGVRLILRGARKKLVLTEEGKRVYTATRDILERCESLQDPDYTVPNGGELSVGGSTVPAQYILPGVLSEFLKRHEDSRCILRRGDSAQIHRLLEKEEVRIGVVGAAIDRRNFTYHTLCSDKLVLITANTERFRKLQAQGICGRDLLQEPMIVREETSGTRQAADAYWKNSGISTEELRIVACMDNPEAIKRSVSEGMGVSVMSELAVREEIKDEKLLAFDLNTDGIYRKIYLVCRKGISLTRTEQLFVNEIQTEFKKSAPVLKTK